MNKLGWKKDKYDKRDYLYKFRAAKIPDTFAIPTVSVRDQGDLGSCVGFGIGGNLSSILVTEEWFSPTWIYNGARFIDGSLNEDCGVYPRDGFEWIRSKGCLKEHFWPYSDVLDKTPPPSKFNPEAAKYPIIDYYRVTGGTHAICEAIAQGHCVSIGTPWFEEWMDISADGKLPNVGSKSFPAGGHETFLYGYNLKEKVFYGQNSWGTEWGANGMYEMPFKAFSVFNKWGGYDAHYVTVNWKPILIKKKKVTIHYSIDDGEQRTIGSFEIE